MPSALVFSFSATFVLKDIDPKEFHIFTPDASAAGYRGEVTLKGINRGWSKIKPCLNSLAGQYLPWVLPECLLMPVDEPYRTGDDQVYCTPVEKGNLKNAYPKGSLGWKYWW